MTKYSLRDPVGNFLINPLIMLHNIVGHSPREASIFPNSLLFSLFAGNFAPKTGSRQTGSSARQFGLESVFSPERESVTFPRVKLVGAGLLGATSGSSALWTVVLPKMGTVTARKRRLSRRSISATPQAYPPRVFEFGRDDTGGATPNVSPPRKPR
jgi:hypothetical protein